MAEMGSDWGNMAASDQGGDGSFKQEVMATSYQRQWHFQTKIDGSGLISEGGREEKREEIKGEQSEWIGERERESD